MLLLAHHDREIIILETTDGPIEIRFSRLDSTQPRIGIDAPRAVRIIRRPAADGDASLPSHSHSSAGAGFGSGIGHESAMHGGSLSSAGVAIDGVVEALDADADAWWHHPDDDVAGAADNGGLPDDDDELLI